MGSGALGFGASLLSSFAMGFVGSMVAQSFFSALGGFGDDGSVPDATEAHNEVNDAHDHGALDNDADDFADDGGMDDGGMDDFDV